MLSMVATCRSAASRSGAIRPIARHAPLTRCKHRPIATSTSSPNADRCPCAISRCDRLAIGHEHLLGTPAAQAGAEGAGLRREPAA